MIKPAKLSATIAASPVLWGCAVSALFYAAVHQGMLTSPFLLRYLAGHWIEYVLTSMFFVGGAAVVIKAYQVRSQFAGLERPLIDEPPPGGQLVSDCPPLLKQLDEATGHARHGYLLNRMRNALEQVRRKGSASTLDAEIKYLSDLDAVQAVHSYSFLRIIIWAIPILGLLGTVIGITMAVANLSPQHLEESLPQVTAGLGIAFDHTAVALVLSMMLMFSQFAVDRAENQLLSGVDARMNAELVGRFQDDTLSADPQFGPMKRMLEAVMQTTENLVIRQTELWQATIEAAHQHWSQLTGAAGQHLESALGGALQSSLSQHAAQLVAGEQAAAESNRRAWSEIQRALVQQAEAMAAQQSELRKQGEVMLKVADATSQVAELENVLNRNLKSLSGAKHFEDTVISLSAAIHMLTARVGGDDHRPHVDLSSKRLGQAA